MNAVSHGRWIIFSLEAIIQSDSSLHGYLISEKPGLEATAWICDDKMGFLFLRPLEVNFASSPQPRFLLDEGEESHAAPKEYQRG